MARGENSPLGIEPSSEDDDPEELDIVRLKRLDDQDTADFYSDLEDEPDDRT